MRRNGRHWTAREIAYLQERYGKANLRDVAAALGRTVGALYRARIRYADGFVEVMNKTRRREQYSAKFGVPVFNLRHFSLDQLDRCADDSARRVLLGAGRPFNAKQRRPRAARVAELKGRAA